MGMLRPVWTLHTCGTSHWIMERMMLGWSNSVGLPSNRNEPKSSEIIRGPSHCWPSWFGWRESRCVARLGQSPTWNSIAQAMKSMRSALLL